MAGPNREMCRPLGCWWLVVGQRNDGLAAALTRSAIFMPLSAKTPHAQRVAVPVVPLVNVPPSHNYASGRRCAPQPARHFTRLRKPRPDSTWRRRSIDRRQERLSPFGVYGHRRLCYDVTVMLHRGHDVVVMDRVHG